MNRNLFDYEVLVAYRWNIIEIIDQLTVPAYKWTTEVNSVAVNVNTRNFGAGAL